MKRWKEGLQWIVIALLLAGAILNMKISLERQEINHRYDRAVKQYESEANELILLNEDIGRLVDHLNTLGDSPGKPQDKGGNTP